MRESQVLKLLSAAVLISALSLVACQKKDGKVEFKTETDKVSYLFGSQVGKNFKEFKDRGIELNIDMFTRAIRDVLADKKLALSDSEQAKVMEAFQQTMRAKEEEKMKKDQTENGAKASKFLAENAAKQGVTTLPDSLQYQVITEGTGPQPKPTDTVKVHYTGTFIDGKEFDSSRKPDRQPLEFTLGQQGMIQGFAEAVQMMKVGSKWKVFIPPKLGYGEFGRGQIGPNTLLIFELELLEIVKNPAGAGAPGAPAQKAGAPKAGAARK